MGKQVPKLAPYPRNRTRLPTDTDIQDSAHLSQLEEVQNIRITIINSLATAVISSSLLVNVMCSAPCDGFKHVAVLFCCDMDRSC